ncbi:RNA-binding protein [bacterium]|nr:RNA-binding protein [bacterium]
MGNRIYVRNISYSTKTKDIKDLFQNIGKVIKINILRDRLTGKSIGRAVVELQNDFEAFAAVERYDEYKLNGRVIRVIPERQS